MTPTDTTASGPSMGNIKTRGRSYLTTMVGKDRQRVKILMHMCSPLAEGSFYDEH
jgi:hypothetical protein